MAGTWEVLPARSGNIEGVPNTSRGLVYEFTADAAAATVPDLPIGSVGGMIMAIDVEFGTAAPTSVVLTVQTTQGVSLVAAESFSSTSRYVPDQPIPVAGGLTLTVTGAAVNSSKAKIVLYMV